MGHWWLLCLWLPLSAFDLSIDSGKEEGDAYSILHLRDIESFGCEATKDEFGETKQIDCTLSHSPQRSFSPIHNTHLNITPTLSKNGYRITITPISKMKLIPIPFDLSKTAQTYQSDVKMANHWIVVGYPKKAPMLSEKKRDANTINLPVKIYQNSYPYVGGLDLKGKPIKIAAVQDVTDYMKLKKAYSEKNFDKVLEMANYTLDKYPNTIFKNELVLYQIRALHELDKSEKLIELSKQYLHDYSGDPGVAEVLAYTANAYNKVGQPSDADYFFDRLFDEQSDSPFASLGMIYKAQQLESTSTKKALPYYEKALSSSKDVEIATGAAFKLAKIELGLGHTDKAKSYIDKIVKANPKYFAEVREDALTMAQVFVDRHEPKSAAEISESLLNVTGKESLDRQILLRNLGMQLAQANKREEALKRFNEYLTTYKFGDYVDQVRRAKDGLFFEHDDKNVTNGLKQYDELIERYGNDSVGRKALYKKAQLLLKDNRYKDVLDLESQLYRLDSAEYPDVNSMILKSAVGLDKGYLKEGKCAETISLQKMYKIKLLPEWDGLRYECALKTTQYSAAKKIAESHLKAKSVNERQVWLYRMVKTQFALGEYKSAIQGGEELATLLGVEKNPPLNEIYRTLFDAMQRSGNSEGMIRHIKNIETLFGNDFNDIERYTQMVAFATARKDEVLTQTYARKVIALQERTKTYNQSPYIEFTLAQSYQKLGKDSDALGVLKSLNSRKLDKEKRSRQQYLIGSLAQRLGNKAEARAAYNASIKADPASAWGKLAKDALGFL
jgi:tetratricopeptide (TPR) repeat protein